MFAVIFEVNPRQEAWDQYLGHAASLRPELLAIDGFIANERYKSLGRPGWLVSLSIWRDEKALIRWRTHALHHDIQGKGRSSVFADYHLRVGEIVSDSAATGALPQHRFDTTEVSAAKAVSITERALDTASPNDTQSADDGGIAGDGKFADHDSFANHVSFANHDRFANHDGFDSITRPGKGLFLRSWRDLAAAEAGVANLPGRHRVIRVIRDYGMFARSEAPQFFPAPPHVATPLRSPE